MAYLYFISIFQHNFTFLIPFNEHLFPIFFKNVILIIWILIKLILKVIIRLLELIILVINKLIR